MGFENLHSSVAEWGKWWGPEGMAAPSPSLSGVQQGVLEQKRWVEGPGCETHPRKSQRDLGKGRCFIDV